MKKEQLFKQTLKEAKPKFGKKPKFSAPIPKGSKPDVERLLTQIERRAKSKNGYNDVYLMDDIAELNKYLATEGFTSREKTIIQNIIDVLMDDQDPTSIKHYSNQWM